MFYQRVFGWEIDQRNALGVRQLSTGAEGMAGGIWPTPPEGKPLVQLFIAAANLESTVARARGLGAQVVVPPQALPEGDALAILVDPRGDRSVCTARPRGGDRERDAPRARARGVARSAAPRGATGRGQ